MLPWPGNPSCDCKYDWPRVDARSGFMTKIDGVGIPKMDSSSIFHRLKDIPPGVDDQRYATIPARSCDQANRP
jgi:hypothetical protein